MLEERNKRASLQTDAEDTERQLKRSLAKVTALGRDREDREAKLRAKQVFPLMPAPRVARTKRKILERRA